MINSQFCINDQVVTISEVKPSNNNCIAVYIDDNSQCHTLAKMDLDCLINGRVCFTTSGNKYSSLKWGAK